MKIRLLTIAAGPQGCLDVGASLDVDPDWGRDLVDRGFAEALDPSPEREPEPAPAPEQRKKKAK